MVRSRSPSGRRQLKVQCSRTRTRPTSKAGEGGPLGAVAMTLRAKHAAPTTWQDSRLRLPSGDQGAWLEDEAEFRGQTVAQDSLMTNQFVEACGGGGDVRQQARRHDVRSPVRGPREQSTGGALPAGCRLWPAVSFLPADPPGGRIYNGRRVPEPPPSHRGKARGRGSGTLAVTTVDFAGVRLAFAWTSSSTVLGKDSDKLDDRAKR